MIMEQEIKCSRVLTEKPVSSVKKKKSGFEETDLYEVRDFYLALISSSELDLAVGSNRRVKTEQ